MRRRHPSREPRGGEVSYQVGTRGSLADRFWAKVEKSDGCWLWLASKFQHGYGSATVDGGRRENAHRVAWRLIRGSIPKGMFVLHRCDNPACVNPDHLWLGTQTDNMRDCAAKGRTALQLRPWRAARGDAHGARLHPESLARGSANGNSVLSEATVLEIRRQTTVAAATLARRLGVPETTVRDVRSGRTWAWLREAAR